jgi:hypothetical protein
MSEVVYGRRFSERARLMAAVQKLAGRVPLAPAPVPPAARALRRRRDEIEDRADIAHYLA